MKYVKKQIFKCWVRKEAYVLFGADDREQAREMIDKYWKDSTGVIEQIGTDFAQVLFIDEDVIDIPEVISKEED